MAIKKHSEILRSPAPTIVQQPRAGTAGYGQNGDQSRSNADPGVAVRSILGGDLSAGDYVLARVIAGGINDRSDSVPSEAPSDWQRREEPAKQYLINRGTPGRTKNPSETVPSS